MLLRRGGPHRCFRGARKVPGSRHEERTWQALIHRHRNQAVDRILIETTGLADVGPVWAPAKCPSFAKPSVAASASMEVISLLEDAKDPLAEESFLEK